MSTSITVTSPSNNKLDGLNELAVRETDANTLKAIVTWDQLANFSQQESIASFIEGTSKNYYSINVADAMNQLSSVGKLLQAAFAGTKGFKSNAEVAVILANYMSLVKNSSVISTSFVEASLKGIKMHSIAITLAEKGKLDKALKAYLKCSASANKMAKESEKLVNEADALLKLSIAALGQASEDETASTKQKKEIQDMIADLETKKAAIESRTKTLESLIEEERKNEKLARERADEAEKRAFITGLVSAIAQPVSTSLAAGAKLGTAACAPHDVMAIEMSNGLREKLPQESHDPEEKLNNANANDMKEMADKLGKQSEQQNAAKNHRSNEMEIAQRRAQYQKDLMEQNADLQESLKKLSFSESKEVDIDKAIQALEISVKTLARVIAIFGNAKKFWQGVAKHCHSLVEHAEIAEEWVDAEDQDEFINEMKMSALYWVSLGNMTRVAALAIADVDEGVDKIMTDLPTRDESQKMLQSMCKELMDTLEKEEKMLDQEN